MYNSYQYPMGMNGWQLPNMQQPQMDRLGQLQQFQQQLYSPQMQQAQSFTIGGKIVDSVDAVRATDIPMDGNMYYFPKADSTEVYAKRWLPNGQTQIVTYKLEVPVDKSVDENEKQATIVNSELIDTFNSRFDELSNKIDKLVKPTANSKVKKEAENE